jgi:ligand-binding SRPBCC domain-containing protein
MALIELETAVAAPRERCFDLARSVELHLDAAASTRERAIAGTTSGLLALGDTVTWEGRHLGLRRRLTVRITGYDRPRWFRDEQIGGPFRSLRHDHVFETVDDGTTLRDAFEFSRMVPLFDSLVLVPYLRRFLLARNELIRAAAEGDGRRRLLSAA